MNDLTPASEDGQSKVLHRLLKTGQIIQQQITQKPQEVFQLIVETVCQTIGADCAVIYPYHPSFGEFYDIENVAAYGLRYDLPVEEAADQQRRLRSRVHRLGEFICEDTKAEKETIGSAFVEREGIRAFTGISLRIEDKILGVLYVDFREPHHFSEAEKQIIRLFGQQAAMAVANAWSSRLLSIRTDTVAKLKTIGQSLVTIQDLPKTLETIAQSAREVLGADIVDLYEYDQSRQSFVLPPVLVGDRRYPDVTTTKIYDDDVVITVVQAKEPQYFAESRQEPSLTGKFKMHRVDAPEQRFVIREGVASSAVIPLIAANETVGVMFVNFRTPQQFPPEQKDVIESFAVQAAVAIYNARLFRLERQQRQQSDTLREVGRIVNSALERDKVIDLVLEQLGQVIEYDSASVQLIEGDRRTLVGSRGFTKTDYPEILRRNVSQDSLIARIVQSRQPVVLSDVKDEPLWDHFPETALVHSWIGIPLVVRDQVIGLLTVDHGEAAHYTQQAGDIVAAFANQVALAIHNADLFSREHHRYRDLNALNQAALNLSRLREADQVYGAIVDAVVDTLECDYCTVFLVEDNELVTYTSGGTQFIGPPKLRFAPGEGLAGWVFQENASLIVSNTSKDSRYQRGPSEEDVTPRSIMLSPMRRGEKVIGVVSADINQPDAFDENNLRLLDTLTSHASSVLQNIELISDFQVLHDVANELPKQPALEHIYQTAVKSAIEALHCRHSTIFIVDQTSGELVAQARAGSSQSAAEVRRFRPGEGLAGAVLKEAHSIKVDDAAKDDRLVAGKVKPRSAPRSIILAPIKIENETLGVISADKDEVSGFTDHNIQVLELLALDVGVAINVRRQLEVLTELNVLSSQLVSIEESPRETRALLEQIAVSAQKVLRADLIELYEYVQVRNEYRLPQISVGNRLGPLIPKDKVYEDDAVFQLIHRSEPLYVERVQADPTLSGRYTILRPDQPSERFVVREQIQSTAAIPLRTGDEVVGLMFASYRRPQQFTFQQKEIIELFANQAAIAMHNSRLFDESLQRRVEALDALNEVGKTLTAGIRLKEHEILELIYQQTHRLTSTRDMYIALYDEATNMIRFPLMLDRGARTTLDPRKTNMEQRGKTEELIFTKTYLLHRTKQESEAWYAQPEHAEFYGAIPESWLGVPMIAGEKVLGVIALYDFEQAYAYDEHDRQTLLSMASQAAIALDNAKLFYEVNQALEQANIDLEQINQDLQRRVEALDALNEVGKTLTAGIRLKEHEILELIYQQTHRLTSTRDMYIALYDEATNMIRFPLMLDRGARTTLDPRKANMEQRGKTEELIFTKTYLLHRTKQESEAWYAQPEHAEFYGAIPESWLGVPMIAGEKVLGVIALWDFEQAYAYDEHDRQTLLSMASQAAIALDNAKLFYEVNQALEQANIDLEQINQDLQRRVEHIQTVQRITNAIKTYAELPELLQSILDLSLPHLNAAVGTIQLLDRETNELVMKAFVGEIEQGQYDRISLDQGLTGEAAREGEPIYVRDTSQDNRFLDYLGNMHSELAIPLKAEGDVIGVFNIEEPRPNAFDEATRELAQLIADQAAIVIHNARAREELIASRQLAALGTATAAIQHRINNTLNLIGPNISRLRRRVDLENETIRDILQIIQRNIKNTTEYIRRIQEPLKDTQIQAVDINASLNEAQALVWQEHQDQDDSGSIEIITNLADPLPRIEASAGQITEIFRNLIENGCKAMRPGGGILVISSRQIDSLIEVEIQDTGTGIPPDILDRLFKKPVPSRQPGQSQQGSGLGLWLSALLLRKYNGEIRITHTGPDGTTVLVRLPVRKRSVQD